MKTATVREVQHHFKEVMKWVDSGEVVRVTRRKNVVAEIARPARGRKAGKPIDYLDRLKKVFPAALKTGNAELISEQRERF